LLLPSEPMSRWLAPEPKRSAKPKTDAPKSKVAKPTIISGAGDRTPTVSVREIVPQSKSIGSSGKELPTTSAPTAPPESATLVKDLAEASGEEVPNASSEDRLAGVDNAPVSDVIEIDDEPEEPEREVPSVQNVAKRKGKEKVQGSTKRTRFVFYAPGPPEKEGCVGGGFRQPRSDA
jgi:hypothetical protein